MKLALIKYMIVIITRVISYISSVDMRHKIFLIYGGQNSKNLRDSSFVALIILHLLCLERFSVFSKL